MKLTQPIQATLFHNKWWSSSRPAYVILELGLNKEAGGPIDITDISEKELKGDPWLVKNNPQKRLPFFYDPSGDLKLNESGGLVQYLLETYDTESKLSPAIGHPTRPEFLKLMHFGPASAYHAIVPIFLHQEEGPMKSPDEAFEAGKKDWHNFVAPTFEQALDKYGGPFLLGDTFSAADIVCGYDLMMLSFTQCSKELLEPHPKIQAYLETISKREAYQKLYAAP